MLPKKLKMRQPWAMRHRFVALLPPMQGVQELPVQYSGLARVAAGLRSLLSPLVGRDSFLRRFGTADGMSFNGRRDLYEVCGYPRAIWPQQYLEKYRRGGIAKRIVDGYPMLVWAGGADVIEDPDPTVTTPFEEDVDTLVRRGLWSLMMRSHKLARLGQYSVIIIGADGDPQTELPMMRGPQDIAFLKPYGEVRAKVKSIVTDSRDPRYGLPALYDVYTGTPTSYSQGADVSSSTVTTGYGPTITVHWSRVHPVAEGLLEDEVYGEPALRSVWNLLLALEKIVHGGPEASWRRADPGLNFNYKGIPGATDDMPLTPEEIKRVEEDADELVHGLRRILVTSFMDTNQLGGPASSQVTQFAANAESLVRQISATTGYPSRYLLGTERGELASSQDDDNLANRAAEMRREFAIPNFRAFIDRLVTYGALRAPREDVYEVSWPEVDELNKEEQIAVLVQIAQANAAQVAAGQKPFWLTDEVRDQILKLPPVDEVDAPTDAAPTEFSRFRQARQRHGRNARIETRLLATLQGRKFLRQLQAAKPETRREFHLVEAPRLTIQRSLALAALREAA